MSLPIPNLDDRSFDDLMKEAKSLIPLYNRKWTNHNPSDPGITLLELFAWLSEMIIYRMNQIPEENYRKFLALIGIEPIFNWDNIPGEDSRRLRDFLIQNYNAWWAEIAEIEKSAAIKIHTDQNSILLERKDEEGEEIKVIMTFDGGDTYELAVKKENGQLLIYYNNEYVFNWDKIPPVEDTKRLLDFLIQSYGVTWVKIASISKTENDHEELIKIFTENTKKKSILLELKAAKDEVTMTFETGDKYEFPVKRENGRLMVYETLERDIRRGLTSISRRYRAITSGDYEFLALECMEKLQKGLAGRAICMNNRNLEFNKEDLQPGQPGQPGHVSVIIIPKGKGYVFNWDEITKQDNLTLREFLMQIFEADWIRTAEIEIEAGNIIYIFQGNFKLTDLALNKLKDEGIPINVVELLKEGLKDKIYNDWIQFIDDLKKTIGGEDTETYKLVILIHAIEGSYISLELADEKKVIMTSNIYRSYKYELQVAEEENGITSRRICGYCNGENKPSDLLKDKVKEYLGKRRLITTRVHVVDPDYQRISLQLCLVLKENTVEQDISEKAEDKIKKYFDPLEGGQDGRGWPLGRNIYRSEIYHLLEGLPGVDHVEKVLINGNAEVNFIEIAPYQLILMEEIVIEVYHE